MDFKGSQFERDIILWGVRWYVAYPISYRQLEERMQERGVEVDHSSLNRWVLMGSARAYADLLIDRFELTGSNLPADSNPRQLHLF